MSYNPLVLVFSKRVRLLYPKPRRVALRVLVAPATEMPSERAISAASSLLQGITGFHFFFKRSIEPVQTMEMTDLRNGTKKIRSKNTKMTGDASEPVANMRWRWNSILEQSSQHQRRTSFLMKTLRYSRKPISDQRIDIWSQA